jgi:hypothetical protein
LMWPSPLPEIPERICSSMLASGKRFDLGSDT